MKKSLFFTAVVLLAGVSMVSAANPNARLAPAGAPHKPTSSGPNSLKPLLYANIADSYERGPNANVPNAISHYVFATIDPVGPDCQATPGCQTVADPNIPGGYSEVNVARAAYNGSVRVRQSDLGSYINRNANDFVAVMVFESDKVSDSATNYKLSCKGAQNFSGQPFNVHAKVLGNTGSGLAPEDPGVRGLFDGRGPFAQVPFNPGVIMTVAVETRGERGDDGGNTAVPGRGPLVQHFSDPNDPNPTYISFDRDWSVDLGDISAKVKKAKASAVTYSSFLRSCETLVVDPNDPNNAIGTITDTDPIPVVNPLYLGITSLRGDARSSARIQDDMVADNIIHLMGDCDYAGEPFGGAGTVVFCQLEWN